MESNKEGNYKLSKKELDSLKEIDKTFPKIQNINIKFGKSGLCYDEKKLDNIVFRVGIISSILSMSKNGLPMGIMITGGYNKNSYNKIIISSEKGQILTIEEEQYFEELINSNNLIESINAILSKLKPSQGKSIIVIGIDNILSSKKLSEILIKGLKCIENCSFNLYNDIPFPSLFFLTFLNQMAFQKIGLKYKMIFVPQDNYWIYLNHCFNKFISYYNMVFKNKQNNNKENNIIENKYENEICIDLSHGIGSLYKNQILNIFNNKENNFQLKINFINDNTIIDNDNNYGIKSIFQNKIPKCKKDKYSSIIKSASLSSDLGSIIYYIDDNNNLNKNEKIKIIKGEKIIILYCKILNFLIDSFSKNLKIKFYEMIKMGIITSLYSNMAFISFCEKNLNNYKLSCVKTGNKNLQKESKKFDISICYEYNGQGSIYINDELSIKFGKLSCLIETSKDSQIIELFQNFITLFNSTTCDGISNLLIIESILKLMNLSLKDVYNFYEEKPYKMIDIEIKEKNKYLNNDDGSKLIEPKEIQKKIDEITSKYKNSRILIRPSETEECLRVYIESDNDEINEKILDELSKCLKE